MARRLDPIGRYDNTNDDGTISIEPLEIPIVGYDSQGNEHEHIGRFQPWRPAGSALIYLATVPQSGAPNIGAMWAFIKSASMPDAVEDLANFVGFSVDVTDGTPPEVMVASRTLELLWMALVEEYSARPTPLPSASDGGGSQPGPISQAAARSRASTSRRSASPKHST